MTGNEAESFLRWPAVAKRINFLIQNEEFLRAEDYNCMPEFERKEMVKRVIRFYGFVPNFSSDEYQPAIIHFRFFKPNHHSVTMA